jgi:uncharacterized protein (TIGR02391 family)
MFGQRTMRTGARAIVSLSESRTDANLCSPRAQPPKGFYAPEKRIRRPSSDAGDGEPPSRSTRVEAVTGFPTADEAAELPIDELALRLLRALAVDSTYANRSYMGNQGVWGPTASSDQVRHIASLHAVEAWDWLIHHGLVALRPSESTVSGQGYVTDGGHAVARDERGLARTYAEARIGVDLHERLARRIRPQFLLGEYELAVFAAMREVEIRVREVGGYDNEVFGNDLMRKAFHEGDGPLTDSKQVVSERQATSHLFAGAIGLFKNPTSHRQVDFDDPTVAAEIVLLADLLLRMLDTIEART